LSHKSNVGYYDIIIIIIIIINYDIIILLTHVVQLTNNSTELSKKRYAGQF